MRKVIKKIPKAYLFIAGLFIISLLIFAVRPEYFFSVKNFLAFDRGALLENIKKEISNSGKLISEATQRGGDLSSHGIISFTNRERNILGLPAFETDSSLDEVARRRLEDMFEEGYFEHVSPSGASAVSEAEAVGYEYISIGENIALGDFANDQALVQAWMDSPGHRANIVSRKFTVIAVATEEGIFDGRRTWISVQIFARPLADCPLVSESLKGEIEKANREIEAHHQDLENRKEELQALQDSSSQREEYEKKVGEYNALVGETNRLIEKVEEMVREYNKSVRAFNACLES